MGYLLAFAATLIWSFNFVVARAVSRDLQPATVSLLRWSVAFVAILPFGWRSLVRDRAVLRQHWRHVGASALLGITLFNTLIYQAGHTTQALNMALLATATPVFTLILSRLFLGEAITFRRSVGILLAISGVVVLVTRGDLSRLASLVFASGDLWMLLASLIFAAYSILARRRPPGLAPISYLTATFGLGLLGILPLAGAEWWMGQGLPVLTWQIGGFALYMGIGASLGGFYCWNGAVERIGPVHSALVYYSLPLFSGAEALLLLGETTTMAHVAGGALLVAGILTATLTRGQSGPGPVEKDPRGGRA